MPPTRTDLKNPATGEIERTFAGVGWREASSEGGRKPVEQRSERQRAPASVQPIAASRIIEIGSRHHRLQAAWARAPKRHTGALGLAVGLALVIGLAGCHGGPDTTGEAQARDPRVILPAVAEQPASEAQAVAERDRLLHDVRLYLAALTGQETGSTHPTLVALERNADAIRDGLRMLYLERDQRGLSWSNSMHRLIAALETHYAVLEQIRNELAELEYRSPPSAPPSAAADEPADEPAGEPADDNP